MNELKAEQYLDTFAKGNEIDLIQSKIDLVHIEQETAELTQVLALIKAEHYEADEFPKILATINQAVEKFGMAKFNQLYLQINAELVAGRLEFTDLSPGVKKFMRSAFFCYERLAEHQVGNWSAQKQEMYAAKRVQIINTHRQLILSEYKLTLEALGNPVVPFEVMKLILAVEVDQINTAFSYKFDREKNFQATLGQVVSLLRESLADYLQALLIQEGGKV